MSVTLAPDYVLRKCDPAPHKCEDCGALVWVSSEDYNYGRSRCDVCGEEPYSVDFYPAEFEKVSINISYTTFNNILDQLGLPFAYSGELSTDLVRSRLPRLEDHVYYKLVVKLVESAEQHGVDIGFA